MDVKLLWPQGSTLPKAAKDLPFNARLYYSFLKAITLL
jgi:hypothetical protein